MEKQDLLTLNSKEELADFYTMYWINAIEKGRLEMPFKGKDKITVLANMIRAVQTSKDVSIFKPKILEDVLSKARNIISEALKEGKNLYGYTAHSNPKGLVEKIFDEIEIPFGRFPFEEAMRYCYSKEEYKESFNEHRWNLKDRDRRVAEYPGTKGVLCRYLSSGGWEILAAVKLS